MQLSLLYIHCLPLFPVSTNTASIIIAVIASRGVTIIIAITTKIVAITAGIIAHVKVQHFALLHAMKFLNLLL